MTPKMPRKSDPLHTEVKTLQEEMTLHEGENAANRQELANTQERIERMEEILKDTRREMDHTKEIITKVTGNDVWNALRAAYPTQSDPTKVENLKIDGKKGAAAFILRLQKAWAEEMGSAWDETTANITLFRIMVKRALPSEVQEKLESVVGLNAMPWASFQANVTHAVEMHRKKKEATKQAAEDLITLLHKAQLGELTRSKQENQEKRKEEKISAKQAAVMMAPTTGAAGSSWSNHTRSRKSATNACGTNNDGLSNKSTKRRVGTRKRQRKRRNVSTKTKKLSTTERSKMLELPRSQS
ncbi:hypothetical protein HF521_008193, partial [Silurus meridionalis]